MLQTISKKKKIAILLCFLLLLDKNKKRMWEKKLLKIRQRKCSCACDTMLLKDIDPDDYQNYLRMNEETFQYLLNKVTPIIAKQDTLMRDSISAEQRLTATLRFLATGRAYECLKFGSKISPQLLGKIIPETCKAIFDTLREEYLKCPSTEDQWKNISNEFNTKWQFGNLLGAMDGKHVRIQKPRGSGSLYYNYKHYFSVVLFAIVNANYEFIYVHVGTNGRVSDSTVWKNTEFYRRLNNGTLNIPPPNNLPNSERITPYVFVGDAAFPLSEGLMKPFPDQGASYEQKIFNYRLSRARRVTENAFGILASRFRFYQKPLEIAVENIDYVILASCVLHNFLRRHSRSYMLNSSLIREKTELGTIVMGEFENNVLDSLQARHAYTYEGGARVRETFKIYFISEGRVEFQDMMLNAVRVRNV